MLLLPLFCISLFLPTPTFSLPACWAAPGEKHQKVKHQLFSILPTIGRGFICFPTHDFTFPSSLRGKQLCRESAINHCCVLLTRTKRGGHCCFFCQLGKKIERRSQRECCVMLSGLRVRGNFLTLLQLMGWLKESRKARKGRGLALPGWEQQLSNHVHHLPCHPSFGRRALRDWCCLRAQESFLQGTRSRASVRAQLQTLCPISGFTRQGRCEPAGEGSGKSNKSNQRF